MARNLLRSIGHILSGVVASLSPCRQAPPQAPSAAGPPESVVGNQPPGLLNFKRSLGDIFIDEDPSPAANDFDEVDESAEVDESVNLRTTRCTRRVYWDRVKCIDSVTSDLAEDCKCGNSCCHLMTIANVLRCRAENAERTSQAQKDHASGIISGFKRIRAVRCVILRVSSNYFKLIYRLLFLLKLSQDGSIVFEFRSIEGLDICTFAFSVQEGLTLSYVYRIIAEVKKNHGHISEPGERRSKGHGGKRHKGLVGATSDEHDFVESKKAAFFSEWFLTEKMEHAFHCPNPDPNEIGIYQIDNMFESEYYEICVADLKDLYHLDHSEIGCQTLWKKVWMEQHRDLVMRVNCSIDSKDRVRFFYFFLKLQCSVATDSFHNIIRFANSFISAFHPTTVSTFENVPNLENSDCCTRKAYGWSVVYSTAREHLLQIIPRKICPQ